ncbi:unnamed protein product, partial [Ascophyllum nodosum]
FGISENEEGKPSKMWSGVADGSIFRNTCARNTRRRRTVLRYLSMETALSPHQR